jgi:hypothetical protein
VTWHGTADELVALHHALRHYCACRFDEKTGELGAPCRAHTLLADQSALDHLVHVRRMRVWFVANEMGAHSPGQTVGGVATVSVRPGGREIRPSRQAPASVGPATRVALNLDALYEAHHRQALWLAYRELGDVNTAEAMVLDALLTVWREDPEAVPTTE